jgi:hypothetical protein
MTLIPFAREIDKQCFEILFTIENYLRTIVRWELRGNNPFDWKGSIPQETIEDARKRQEQESDIAYLDILESGVLSYLTLSELKDLILGPLWSTSFKLSWPPLDVVKSEFKKLIAVRNKLAHFRTITTRDIKVATRFAEDLATWTEGYRNIRRYSSSINFGSSNPEGHFIKFKIESLFKYWATLNSKGTIKEHGILISKLGHHISIQSSVMAGSINSFVFLDLLDKSDHLISFCRIADTGETVVIYLPAKINNVDLQFVLEKVVEMCASPDEVLSSSEAQNIYGMSQREGLLYWEIELPPNFLF